MLLNPSAMRRPWTRIVGCACLALPFLAMLWVPGYARGGPPLLGLPFFYWYQLLWVLLTPALMVIAYRVLRQDWAVDGPAS